MQLVDDVPTHDAALDDPARSIPSQDAERQSYRHLQEEIPVQGFIENEDLDDGVDGVENEGGGEETEEPMPPSHEEVGIAFTLRHLVRRQHDSGHENGDGIGGDEEDELE